MVSVISLGLDTLEVYDKSRDIYSPTPRVVKRTVRSSVEWEIKPVKTKQEEKRTRL